MYKCPPAHPVDLRPDAGANVEVKSRKAIDHPYVPGYCARHNQEGDLTTRRQASTTQGEVGVQEIMYKARVIVIEWAPTVCV